MSYHVDLVVQHLSSNTTFTGTLHMSPNISDSNPHADTIKSDVALRFEHAIKECLCQRIYSGRSELIVIPAEVLAQSIISISVRFC